LQLRFTRREPEPEAQGEIDTWSNGQKVIFASGIVIWQDANTSSAERTSRLSLKMTTG